MVKKVQSVVYFSAVMYNPEFSDNGMKCITRLFGDTILLSDEFDFDHTSYYEPEMGTKLRKYFAAFVGFKYPGSLPRYKLKAINAECRRRVDNKRVINIDPGYLAMEKVVVASTKNFTHRVYLGRGIYGDLQLMRQKGRYSPMAWTYADYTRPEAAEFFEKLAMFWQDIVQEQ